MNIEESAAKGLFRHGLSETAAALMVRRMIAFQPDEWNRIVDRAKSGSVEHLYVLVVNHSSNQLRTFLYAPGKVDNIESLKALLADNDGVGGWENSIDDTGDNPPTPHEVSQYDIAEEINRHFRDLIEWPSDEEIFRRAASDMRQRDAALRRMYGEHGPKSSNPDA